MGLILEASQDKSNPPSLGQTFNVKCWMAAVMYPESSQGGAQCWGSGCMSNTAELPKTELRGAGTRPLNRVQGSAKHGNFPTDPFDRVSKTFKRFIAFDQ